MTTKDIEGRVAAIKQQAAEHDDESAHILEDALWQVVMEAIADGDPNASRLAAAALKTKDIKFARWCA